MRYMSVVSSPQSWQVGDLSKLASRVRCIFGIDTSTLLVLYMCSLTKRPSGIYWLQFTLDGHKKTRSLGRIDRGLAMSICGKFETLMSSGKTDQALETVTAQVTPEKQPSLIHLWVQAYLRSLGLKHATQLTHHQTLDLLTAQFGTCSFRDVDVVGAQKFAASLDRFAPSTRAKHLGRTKQYFQAAVDHGVIETNPFASMKCGGQANPSRAHFVSREDFARLLAACPNPTWRAIVALSRIGGIRVPSEMMELHWNDVEADKIRIVKNKTASRHFPMFPELKAELEPLDLKYRLHSNAVIGFDGCLNYGLKQIIEKAGLKKWPRLWHNMRASRITELANDYPIQTVVAWMGNSPEVALKHYLQVQDEHWRRAIG